MERTFRKIIKRTREINIFLFFVLFFSSLCFCQDINIFEEIEGKDLSEKKTIIFNIFPVFEEEKKVPFKLPEIKLEEKEEKIVVPEEKKEGKIVKEKEEKKSFLTFKFGSFGTKCVDINYTDKKIKFDLSSFFTENYRENSGLRYYSFSFSHKGNNNHFDIGFSVGTTELPGPTFSIFNIEREWHSLNWNYTGEFKNFLFGLSHKYYFIEPERTHFLDFNLEKKFENFKSITGIEIQVFQNNYNIFGFSQNFIFEKEKLLIKLGLKFYMDEKLRILPGLTYKINDNLSIFLDSYYRNPDLWKDVIMDNWKEIKRERLIPEEIYKGGIKFNLEKTSFELSYSYNDVYLWEDMDKNYLYEPYKENFWKASFILNTEMPITDLLNFFLNFQKDIFNKEIYYLPGANIKIGFEFKKRNYTARIYNSYTGKREFSYKIIDGFSLLNFEVCYKNRFEIGAGIYNILNQEYEIAPYYPGEKRKFLFWIKF